MTVLEYLQSLYSRHSQPGCQDSGSSFLWDLGLL